MDGRTGGRTDLSLSFFTGITILTSTHRCGFWTEKVWQHWDLQEHCKPEFKWSSQQGIHTVKVENKSSHKADMSYIWHALSAEYGSLTATFLTVHKGIKCLNTFCLGLWVCKVLQHHWACVFLFVCFFPPKHHHVCSLTFWCTLSFACH